jgi:DNA repair protein RecO
MDKLFEIDHPHHKSYQSIVETIENIDDVPVETLRIVVFSRIISDLGIQPQLSTCAFCGLNLSSTEGIVYDEQGEFYHTRCFEGENIILPNTIKYLKLNFTKNLSYVCKIKVAPEVLQQAKEYFLKNFIWHFGTNNANRVLFDIDNHE